MRRYTIDVLSSQQLQIGWHQHLNRRINRKIRLQVLFFVQDGEIQLGHERLLNVDLN